MYYTVIKHFGHLRTLEKCRNVFSNARRVLSQFIIWLRLVADITRALIGYERSLSGHYAAVMPTGTHGPITDYAN